MTKTTKSSTTTKNTSIISLLLPSLTLLLLQNIEMTSATESCPLGCLCISQNNAVPASYCDAMGLQSIPPNISPSTEILSVTMNRLSKLSKRDFTNLKHLTRLNLKKNGIQQITKQAFRGLVKLKSLNLGMNALSGTSLLEVLENLPSLEELYLNDNRLVKLPANLFKALPNLKKLHLQNNMLTDEVLAAVANMKQLELLDLSNNKLTSIRARAFENAPNLKSVRLGGNQIGRIETGAFDSLPQLTEVLLNGNEINTLDIKVLIPTSSNGDDKKNAEKSKLSKVTLHGNPLRCDCNLYWIYAVLTASPSDNIFNEDKDKMTCHSPSTVAGKPLLELYKGGDFACDLSVWGTWQSWSECSKHCGGGQKYRRRSCITGRSRSSSQNDESDKSESDCKGSSEESEDCNLQTCTVNGLLSKWSSWTNCPPGDYAERSRTRKCVNPFAMDEDDVKSDKSSLTTSVGATAAKAANYDITCPRGQLVERELCYGLPVDGGWSQWSEWSDCSKLCRLGTSSRTRTCTNPIPQFGGNLCDSMTIEKQTKVCLAALCPPNTEWGAWGVYSECSSKCGQGIFVLVFLLIFLFLLVFLDAFEKVFLLVLKI